MGTFVRNIIVCQLLNQLTEPHGKHKPNFKSAGKIWKPWIACPACTFEPQSHLPPGRVASVDPQWIQYPIAHVYIKCRILFLNTGAST